MLDQRWERSDIGILGIPQPQHVPLLCNCCIIEPSILLELICITMVLTIHLYYEVQAWYIHVSCTKLAPQHLSLHHVPPVAASQGST